MSVLDDIFYALDTPGAYARGALSGRFGQRASGQDVLRAWGMNDPNKWAGIAAEMVLDPINLIPGGIGLKALRGAKAATQANRAARIMIRKGAMPAELAATTKAGVGGKPTLLMHGTQATFDKIDPSKFDPYALKGPGFYNTESGYVASGYSKNKKQRSGHDLLSSKETERFFTLGRKLTGGAGGAPSVSGGHAIVTKYDPKIRKVSIQDYDKEGKILGNERAISGSDLSRYQYDQVFNPPAQQVRIGYMNSKKVFDLEEVVSVEVMEDIGNTLEEVGFKGLAEKFPYRQKLNIPITGEIVRQRINNIVIERLEGMQARGLRENLSGKGNPWHEIEGILEKLGIDKEVFNYPNSDALKIEHMTPIISNAILRKSGYDTITHGGGAGRAIQHKVHIGLMGDSQMYLPYVAPAIKRVPKPRIGLLAAGAAGYQAGTRIGLRPRQEQQIGLRR